MTHYLRRPVPRSMPVREMEMLLAVLKDIRRVATKKNPYFPDDVKSTTTLWREAWPIAPLDELIERYEGGLAARYEQARAKTRRD